MARRSRCLVVPRGANNDGRSSADLSVDVEQRFPLGTDDHREIHAFKIHRAVGANSSFTQELAARYCTLAACLRGA